MMLVISKEVNVSDCIESEWSCDFFFCKYLLLIFAKCHSCGQMLTIYYPVISVEQRWIIGWQGCIERQPKI